MIQTIGKYRVLERIGRGGMGTVLKAHDPVLDRTVALKVISSDVDVTDELRARFFREAQACARLTHPNIVTVYDLADVEGRLFIVMELLEGDELRHVIGQRRPLALETKLAVMTQVCDGLGYAHQRGVVHRDIKPGNIFILRNGNVKILDFGIARIASAEAGLTRTGLIMGTLRYMAPEQARGRADHRSDIFSVGSVFYEFLAYRPAFAGDDPMEILEALRAQDPPRLNVLDPAIPSELAELIVRAMQKDPGERFQDLAELRRGLDAIRRRILEEAEQVRTRLQPRLAHLRQLQTSLDQELGGRPDDETMPLAADDAGGLAGLLAVEQQAASRLGRFQPLLERARTLRPAVEHALELLDAGDAEGAVRELEPVVQELPEHARAAEALARARARVEATRALSEAAGALRRRAFADCLDRVQALLATAPPADIAQEAGALAEKARAGQAAEEAEARRREVLREERARAERVRGDLDAARRRGELAGGPADATETWREAASRAAAGQAAFADERYLDAHDLFEAAAALYGRAEADAHEARRARARTAAETARERSAQGRATAAELDAPTHAATIWARAAALETRGAEALAKEDFDVAGSLFSEAVAEYDRAAGEAREARRRREQEAAERVRAQMERARGLARESAAQEHATQTWHRAESARIEGEGALAESLYRRAEQGFEQALSEYRRAADESREVVRARQRALAEDARARAEEARQEADAAGAGAFAADPWAAAERINRRAGEALGQGAFIDAQALFLDAWRAYDQARETARRERLRVERAHAEARREQMDRLRRQAHAVGASERAEPRWTSAEAKRSEAVQAFAETDFVAAASAFDEAGRLFEAAEAEARAARDAAARRADSLAREAARLLGAGDLGKALAQAQAALDLVPDQASALDTRSRAAAAIEQARIEQAAIERLVRDARARLAGGDTSGALAILSGLQDRDPSHPEAARLLDEARALREAARAAPAEGPVGPPVQPPAGDLQSDATATVVAARAPTDDAESTRLGDAAWSDMTRVQTTADPSLPAGAGAPADTAPVRSVLWRAWLPRLEKFSHPRGAAAGAVGVLLLIALVYVLWPAPRPDIETSAPPVEGGAASLARLKAEVAGARGDAEAVDAERLAAALFKSAAEAERQGDAAAAAPDAETARTRYERARAGFREAALQARNAATTALRARTTAARDAAERAGAPEWAREPWTRAEDTARRADDLASRGDHDGARAAFAQAERLYQDGQNATIEARDRATKEEQARAAAAEKERAAAAEKDRSAAAEKERSAAAERERRAAAERERSAAAEKARAAEQARLSSAQQSRTATVAARDAAGRVEAPRHAAEAFGAGREHEREADAALARRDYDAAERGYREAQARYEEARISADRKRLDLARAEGLQQAARAAAEESSQRAQAARRTAEQEGADRQAGALMKLAQSAEAEGQAALGRNAYDRARQAFRSAETEYQHAVDVSRSRKAAAGLRDIARNAGAETLAKPHVEAATAKWNQAESQASGGNPAGAVQTFKEAGALYAEAERRVRDVVREAEGSAKTRRDGAVKAGADMLAKDVFDAASAKLRDGETSVRSQNWTVAAQAYREAADRYEAAERRVGEIGQVRAEAETARKRREQALRVGAETLAKDLFDEASARHVEADRRARGANVLAAIPIYKDATERYGEAERRARDLATTRAQPDPPKERASVEKKRPSPPSRDADGEIRAVLTDYSRAFETKDATLLRRLRPGLSQDELQRYRELWDAVATFKVTFKVDRIDVTGDEAEVTGRREDTVVHKDGRREPGGRERSFRFKLKRGGERWAIEAVN